MHLIINVQLIFEISNSIHRRRKGTQIKLDAMRLLPQSVPKGTLYSLNASINPKVFIIKFFYSVSLDFRGKKDFTVNQNTNTDPI